MAKNYNHLIRKDETSRELKAMVDKLNISDKLMKTIGERILFEEEAKQMIEYLQNNPKPTEEQLLWKMFDIIAKYAEELGIGQGRRMDIYHGWAK